MRNLEGRLINTVIEGTIVTGRVISSYRNQSTTKHIVKLQKPVQYRWRSAPVDTVILKDKDVLVAFG